MKRLVVLLALPLLLAACTISQAGQDAVDRLSTLTDTDLDQALALAELNSDTAATQCWKAMKAVVVKLRVMHNVGAVTTFQLGMDITSPAGYLNVQCAAERQAVKDRVALFTGKAATLAATFGL